jgi:hypothetical protein
MKNWLYIPFLILMSVTYTRLVDNYNSEEGLRFSRGPASVPEAAQVKDSDEDCLNLPAKFNPHLNSKKCSL